jgi:hypothetical protein
MTQRRASELDIAVMRKLRSQGATYLEISQITGFSEFTVKRHVGHIKRPQGCQKLPDGPALLSLVRMGQPYSDIAWDFHVGLEAVRNAVKKALRAEKAMRARA